MPINIHGKIYNTVAERIASAGKDLLNVSTEVLNNDPVVIKATITTTKGTFTGISAANASKQIEKESPYEVAETSAVGRALAFAGYETTNGIASAEEMKKVQAVDNFGEVIICDVCGEKLVFKKGKTKDGREYEGWFCPNGTPTEKHSVKKFKYLTLKAIIGTSSP